MCTGMREESALSLSGEKKYLLQGITAEENQLGGVLSTKALRMSH